MSKKYICTLDYGNTKDKGALYLNDDMVKEFIIKDFTNIIKEYNLNVKNCQLIECSVKNTHRVRTNLPSINVKDFYKDGHFFDMKVSYSETLGMDRLVQAFYQYSNSKSSKAIIDAGTFTTLDFIGEKGFLGGFILPGLEVLKKTYRYGELLKSHDIVNYDHSEDIPRDTLDAMKSGLHYSFISPLVELLVLHKSKEVILTGGNTNYLKQYFEQDKRIKKMKINIDDHLIHKSLKYISEKALLP